MVGHGDRTLKVINFMFGTIFREIWEWYKSWGRFECNVGYRQGQGVIWGESLNGGPPGEPVLYVKNTGWPLKTDYDVFLVNDGFRIQLRPVHVTAHRYLDTDEFMLPASSEQPPYVTNINHDWDKWHLEIKHRNSEDVLWSSTIAGQLLAKEYLRFQDLAKDGKLVKFSDWFTRNVKN